MAKKPTMFNPFLALFDEDDENDAATPAVAAMLRKQVEEEEEEEHKNDSDEVLLKKKHKIITCVCTVGTSQVQKKPCCTSFNLPKADQGFSEAIKFFVFFLYLGRPSRQLL